MPSSTTASPSTPTLDDVAPGQTPAEVVDQAARLLAALTMHHPDGAELVAHIATEATRLLPRGVSLVDGRPGSWEADLVERLVDPDAVRQGPGPTPAEVECPRCSSPPGQPCWNPRTYYDNRHPHRERVALAASDSLTFCHQYGWC